MKTGHAVLLAAVVAGGAAAGCSGLLPRAEEQTESPWQTFEEAKRAFDDIKLGNTDRNGVHRLGFDPSTTPNVLILNYSQIANAVLPGERLIPGEEVPAGIRSCVRAQDRCVGYQLEENRIRHRRIGNFWGDFLNFRRETATSGWRFKALVVLVDDHVVFKQWSGQPEIRETNVKRNPLGPLQGAGERLSPKP